MRKNLLAFMLTLLLSFTCFTACSSDTGSEPVNAEETTETEKDTQTEPETEEVPAEPETQEEVVPEEEVPEAPAVTTPFSLADIPAFSGKPYVPVNNNIPYFTEDEITASSYEAYGELDSLGRCTITEASVGQDLMPTEERGKIGQVKPAGWHTVKYDFVDGKYLYNRCHLIGFQLTGENANRSNLITGTRYLNIEGMLPFENMTADYVKETGNHVMYRVTPVYDGDDLLAAGVLMEGYSVEDEGAGITFCVFAYNEQPGVVIDHATGESHAEDGDIPAESVSQESAPKTQEPVSETDQGSEQADYVVNTNTGKFHRPDCSSVDRMSEENRIDFSGTREELIAQGYEPCGRCHP